MLEKLMDFVFSVSSLFDRSSDSLLNEYRGYQRRMFGYLVLGLLLMVMAIFVAPGDAVPNSLMVVVAETQRMFSLGLIAAAVLALVVATWNGFALYRFEKKHGIRD